METWTYDEAMAFCDSNNVHAQARMFIQNFFQDCRPGEGRSVEAIKEKAARPVKGRRKSIADTHTILTVRGDR